MALAILAALAVIAGCYFASAVVLPSVVALFMAMLVAPLAHRLIRWGLGRGWASFAAVAAALAAVFMAGFLCYHAAAGVVQQAPQYESRLRHAATRAETKLSRFRLKTQNLVPPQPGGAGGQEQGGPAQGAAGARAGGQGDGGVQWSTILLRGLGSLVEAAGLAIFVPFLALFMLLEEEPLSRALDRAVGPDYDAARLRRQAPKMARAYVFGNLILALALAIVQGGLFLVLGLPNAIGLGVVTGLLNVVPILGVPVAVALPLLQGAGTLHGAAPFAAIAVTLLTLHLVAANWIIPRTIGVHVKVNSTTATLSMLFFSWLWGLVGFLMAVPLAAILKIALECSPRSAALAPLLASHEEEPQPPRERREAAAETPAGGPLSRLRRWSRRRFSRRPARA